MLPRTTFSRVANSAAATVDRPSTDALLFEAQQGSRSACEQLLVASLPDLRRWARRRLPPTARGHMDTCDLVQDAALLTFARLARFNPEHAGSMPAYLRQVARNRVCDEFRRTVRRPQSVALDDTLQSGQPSPLTLASAAEARGRYRRALRKLRSKDRRLVIARYESECGFATIASQFNLPSIEAARMAVNRAEHRLRHQLEEPVRPSTDRSR